MSSEALVAQLERPDKELDGDDLDQIIKTWASTLGTQLQKDPRALFFRLTNAELTTKFCAFTDRRALIWTLGLGDPVEIAEKLDLSLPSNTSCFGQKLKAQPVATMTNAVLPAGREFL